MNYYKHGDAANADRIKAAFEKLGFDVGTNSCAQKGLYFTFDGKVCYTNDYVYPRDMMLETFIKKDPDYKELELPVEPKFKVGDWVVSIDDEGDVSTEKVMSFSQNKVLLLDTDGCFTEYPKGELKSYHLWTIQDVKDGDVIVFNDSPDVNLPLRWVGIYKQPRVVSNKSYWFHCIITPDCTFKGYDSWWMTNAHPATKEQRDLLFTKMKEAGYEWDAGKKELLKIKHYAIANFHAGMPVLVRDNIRNKWLYTLFGMYNETNVAYPFVVVDMRGYAQCIPFNNDTKHLLGTTEPCSEEYINW